MTELKVNKLKFAKNWIRHEVDLNHGTNKDIFHEFDKEQNRKKISSSVQNRSQQLRSCESLKMVKRNEFAK